MNVDADGIYRAYVVSGSVVVDAARLTAEQTETWLLARAGSGQLDEVQIAVERKEVLLADSAAVAEAELLHPPDAIKPKDKLALMVAAGNVTPRSALQARQDVPTCAPLFCVNDARRCRIVYPPGRCVCNGSVCVG